MIHIYWDLRGWIPIEEQVPQGQPHGDAWGKVMHPDASPSHDVERYLETLEKKSKKERS